MIRRRIVVSGQVQGVGFRYHTREQAIRLGVSGTVANDPDGSVVVEAEGDAGAVDRLVEWLRTGPQWADVAALDISDVDSVGSTGFDVVT